MFPWEFVFVFTPFIIIIWIIYIAHVANVSHWNLTLQEKKKKQQRNKTVAARQLVQDNLRSAVSFQNKSKIWYTDISV